MINMLTSEKIWLEIKDLQMSLFGLPPKRVQDFVQPATVEPSKLYLIFSVQAVIPALETVVGNKFKVDNMLNYITVEYSNAI